MRRTLSARRLAAMLLVARLRVDARTLFSGRLVDAHELRDFPEGGSQGNVRRTVSRFLWEDKSGHDDHGRGDAVGDRERGSKEWFGGLTKISGAKGSNPGGLHVDKDGQKWYVKEYKDPAQAAGEKVTNDIYLALGARAPESVMGEGGKFASKWVEEGGKTLGQTGVTKESADKILDHYVADVFVANWDAVGTGHDNVLVSKGGEVTRIDQGGSLLYRAQGGLKPEGGLGKIGEWNTLADRGMNPYYAQVFKAAGVKDGDALGSRAVKQIDRIVAVRPPGGWKAFVEKSAPRAPKGFSDKVGAMLESRQRGLEAKRTELKARGLSTFYFRALWPTKDGHDDHGRGEAAGPKEKAGKSVAITKPSSADQLAAHSAATMVALDKGTAKSGAVLALHDDPAAREKLIAGLSGGKASEKALAEYAHTPAVDIAVLSGITVKDTPVQGQAYCEWNRAVTMGSTSASGDYRHELGHAIHMSMSKDLQGRVQAMHKEAMDRVKANPEGTQKKLSHEFYEKAYGVIGRRALDNWHENFAEHYRGYHKAVHQTRSGEDKAALGRYAERFPKWNALWDARYSTVGAK